MAMYNMKKIEKNKQQLCESKHEEKMDINLINCIFVFLVDLLFSCIVWFCFLTQNVYYIAYLIIKELGGNEKNKNITLF